MSKAVLYSYADRYLHISHDESKLPYRKRIVNVKYLFEF